MFSRVLGSGRARALSDMSWKVWVSGFQGLGFQGLGFQGLGFQGLGFQGLGFRVSGFRV